MPEPVHIVNLGCPGKSPFNSSRMVSFKFNPNILKEIDVTQRAKFKYKEQLRFRPVLPGAPKSFWHWAEPVH